MKTLKFLSKEEKFSIILPPKPSSEIIRAAKKYYPNEVGGALVGYYDKNKNNAIVISIINITEGGRFQLKIKGKSLHVELQKIWKQSKGTLYYLGEWHSHPNNTPKPSILDRKTMMSIGRSKSEYCTSPILIIIGNEFENVDEDLQAYIFPKCISYIKTYKK